MHIIYVQLKQKSVKTNYNEKLSTE